MALKIALAGNPNCGKTTMFNELTGSSQYVGNWPGVTVEKKEGKLKGHKEVKVVDLPGIYSLSPYTLEEVVTRNFLAEEKPEVIVNIVDASNMERNLYLTTQLMEMGIPVVVALNMMDIVRKNGDVIDTNKLSKLLGAPVLETSALKGEGLSEVVNQAVAIAKTQNKKQKCCTFTAEVEKAIGQIEELIKVRMSNKDTRWFAIKLFERDHQVMEKLQLDSALTAQIDSVIGMYEEKFDDDAESVITNERYEYIGNLIKNCHVKKNKNKMTTSDKIDQIVTNRFLALPIFAAVMFVMYYVSVTWVGTIITDWTNDVFVAEILQGNIGTFLESVGTSPWLHSLIVDGIVGGVGAVLGFVPQIMLLFFFISFLEDCGYMARVAFIMDRLFRKFGLSGKSFIPMLIGTGCSVPGIMASRTIENDKDRKMTIILTPFIPCGAKLPVFALMIGALFPTNPFVGPSMYFLGIAMVIVSGIILKQTKAFKGDPAPFVMELPQYRMPGIKGIAIHMWERGKSFIIKAGTVIFVACGLIWFLQSFNWSLQMVEANESILASIGRVIAPIFVPLGFGTWEAAVATVTGFLAKETVVATFGVLFGIADATETDPGLLKSMSEMFTPVSAYAFMVFTLLAAPCFAAIGATKREMGTWKWTLIAMGYQTGLAYVVALLIYQVGSLIFK